jgi:hypothetical protein
MVKEPSFPTAEHSTHLTNLSSAAGPYLHRLGKERRYGDFVRKVCLSSQKDGSNVVQSLQQKVRSSFLLREAERSSAFRDSKTLSSS